VRRVGGSRQPSESAAKGVAMTLMARDPAARGRPALLLNARRFTAPGYREARLVTLYYLGVTESR
jgi:hypothetical protein